MSVTLDKNTAPAAHIHVGHNIPGYLPESDVMCFDSVEDALDALRHEIKDQQDYYWENCQEEHECDNSCEWCDAAADCEAALSAIADGDAAYHVNNGTGRLHIFSPPEGPDIAHWLAFVIGERDDCEIFADQES